MSKKGLLRVRSLTFILLALGVGSASWPLLTSTLYQNYFYGTGILLCCLAWGVANFLEKEKLIKQGRWEQQKKAMIALFMCLSLGLGLLTYYEMQRPKYLVSMVKNINYVVPPQLNSNELRILGQECNTYGNTLCSHQVFAKLVRQDPRDFAALTNLAMAQTHLGFHQQAITNFETALKHGFETYDLYKFYGGALLKAGLKDEAISAYKKSLSLYPNQPYLIEKIEELTVSK